MKRPQKKFVLIPAEDYLYDMSSDEEKADYSLNHTEKKSERRDKRGRSKRRLKNKWDTEATEYFNHKNEEDGIHYNNDDNNQYNNDENIDESGTLSSKMNYFFIVVLIVAGLYILTHPEIKVGDREIGSFMPSSMLSIIKNGRDYLKEQFFAKDKNEGSENDDEDGKEQDHQNDTKVEEGSKEEDKIVGDNAINNDNVDSKNDAEN